MIKTKNQNKYFTERKNVFPASDWFDLNFLADFLQSKSRNKEFLNEQIYKIGKEKLSSRVLNHWYEVGILEDDRPDGKGWKKFSISELIWIQIVKKLRGFGLDLSRIKKVKREINLYNTKDNLSKCPLLDFYILVAINTPTPVKLIVFESGEASINRQIEIDIANQLGLISEDYISIDLNKLVDKFYNKKRFNTDYLGYSDIPKSRIVEEIERSLSTKDIQSLTIKVKGKDYIIGEEFFTKDKVKARALMSVLQFGRLVEHKNAGKSTYSVTNQKKIKKG